MFTPLPAFNEKFWWGHRIKVTVVMQYDFGIWFEHILLISQKDKRKVLTTYEFFLNIFFFRNMLLTMKNKAYNSFLL